MRRHGDDELEIGRARVIYIFQMDGWAEPDANTAITITDSAHFRCAIIMRAAT